MAIAGVIVIFISVSLPLIAVKFACTVFAPSAIYVANAPVNPAAEKSTVVADVASIIALPWVTVAASSTTIVNAHVACPFVPLAVKSSNSAALPSIVAVTVPVVEAITLFTCATWSAVISSNAGVITILIFVSLFLIAVRLACAVFAPSAIYVANAPVNPAAEKSTVATDVASTIFLPCATVATSSTVIV